MEEDVQVNHLIMEVTTPTVVDANSNKVAMVASHKEDMAISNSKVAMAVNNRVDMAASSTTAPEATVVTARTSRVLHSTLSNMPATLEIALCSVMRLACLIRTSTTSHSRESTSKMLSNPISNSMVTAAGASRLAHSSSEWALLCKH